jgi:hypothetical protein
MWVLLVSFGNLGGLEFQSLLNVLCAMVDIKLDILLQPCILFCDIILYNMLCIFLAFNMLSTTLKEMIYFVEISL